MAEEEGRRAADAAADAPDPEDPRKPHDPTELTQRSWLYVARTTLRQFMSDQCTDLAAALTYFGVLAVFPALLAIISVLGLVADPKTLTSGVADLLGGLLPADTLDPLRTTIGRLAENRAAGLGLAVGVVGAIWSASGYVGAFSRAMNRVYGIQEGRPIWKLRPVTLLVTVLAVIVAVVAALIVTASGSLADRLGDQLGLPPIVVTIWGVAKWILLAGLAILVVAVLYYAAPNVRQPRFRWMSVGSLVALAVWALASLGFAIYAANFASYDRTYGAVGGIILFLLWVWISNNALLFGAELDAELERGRQLQAGIAAEETLQLPPRDTRASDKKAAQHERDVAAGRELRLRHHPESAADEKGRDGAAPARRGRDDRAPQTSPGGADAARALRRSRRRLATALRRLRRHDDR